MNLSVDIAGVTMKNPVTTGSGTFGSGEEFSEFVDLSKLGAVTTKGVANVPWPGNPTPRVAEVYGGMSGPAIKPVAVRMVYQVANAVDVPIIGMGGIATAEDALEFIMAGATAVSVGTANFINPATTLEVVDGIKAYMERHQINDINELIGCVK